MHFKAENLTIPKHPRLLFLAQNLGVLWPSKSWGHFFWDTLYVKNFKANKNGFLKNVELKREWEKRSLRESLSLKAAKARARQRLASLPPFELLS